MTRPLLLGEKDEIDYSYYSLAWSPAEDVVVLGFRTSEDQPAQVFWLFDPGRSRRHHYRRPGGLHL